MQTRIGQVRIRYRVPAGHAAAATLASLQSIAQQKIADSCDQAFANVFEDDEAVYVLRRVTSRVAVLAKRPTSEARLAEQWGRKLCTSVVRTIVRNEDDDNLVRFECQAQFVTSFLTRLAVGDAWDRWYFGAFNDYRGLPPAEIVTSVLEDNHKIASQILSRLEKANALETVLKFLGQNGQRHLWEKVIRTAPLEDQTVDAFRIFAQAAFLIADVLSIWQSDRPSDSAVLESYLRTRPTAPNWTSGLSLADAVSSLLRFMVHEQLVDATLTPTGDQIAQLRETLASRFDWLDTSHLFNSVLTVFDATHFVTATRQFTLRPRQATPSQNRILDDLLLLLRSRKISISADASRTHENLLRMVAAISESADEAVTTAVAGLLESVVTSALIIQSSSNPREVLSHIQRGELPRTVSLPTENAVHLKSVIDAGDSAQSLVTELVQRSLESSHEEGVQIESECAGLFLLIRVVQDLRLVATVKACGGETIEPLLAGLAVAICKQSAWSNEAFDQGAAVWAGVEPAEVFAALDHFDWQQLITDIFETATAQHLIDPTETAELVEGFIGPYSEETAISLNQVCALLVRAWARWIPGLAHSSTNYLLDNFIRRSGSIIVNEQRLTIELERRPLDEILKLSGYLADTPPVSWLQNRTVRYRFSE